MAFSIKENAEQLRDKLFDLAETVREHDPELALRCMEQVRLLIESIHKNRNGNVPSKVERGVAALFSQAQRSRIQDTIERRKAMNISAVAIPMIEEAKSNGNGHAEG